MTRQTILDQAWPLGWAFVVSGATGVMMLALVLYIIAFVLLVLAAFNVGHPTLSLGWLGLAIWLLTATLLPHFG